MKLSDYFIVSLTNKLRKCIKIAHINSNVEFISVFG